MPPPPTDNAGERSTTVGRRPPALDAVLLGGGILLILALALILQAGPEPDPVGAPRAVLAKPIDFASEPAEYTVEILEPAPMPQAPTPVASLESLAGRARSDAARLQGSSQAWILQIAAVCDPENAERALAAAGVDRRLHLLPAMIGDQPCFRICWGPYPTAEDAARADDLSASVGALGQPQARRVSELLP